MTIQEQLKLILSQAVSQAFPDINLPKLDLTHPDLDGHGDYSSNIALILARQVGQPPLAVAEAIVAQLPESDLIATVSAIAPGFINIHLSQHFLLQAAAQVLEKGSNFGRSEQPMNSQKIFFEYGTPNTHKLPHIGHLFSFCYGESTVRLLEAVGHEVFRENYQGDVGLHVAKCLWAYQRAKNAGDLNNLDALTLAEKVELLQSYYQEGSLAYDEDPEAKQAINQINTLIYQRDPEIVADWELTRSWSVAYYEQFEERIGIHYNKHFYESQTSESGIQVVRDHIGPVFEEDEGAVIFRGEKYGLHTRVFINQAGNPTYEAKDMGLITLKMKEGFDFDKAIVVTANEQTDYWKVVNKAQTLVYPELEGKVGHIGHGMINLTTGKMSSRTGQIVTAFSLVEMVKQRVREYIEANRDYTPEETEQIAELVGLGAIKYSFLKSAATKNITFDLESSVAFDGNSGPYLQYTYARCQSVLRKSAANLSTHLLDSSKKELNNDELSVLRWLYRFPEVIQNAADQYAPHILASYLFELAQRYSYFYNQHQILIEDKDRSMFRLQLTQAVAQVLGNGLHLLGLEAADKI